MINRAGWIHTLVIGATALVAAAGLPSRTGSSPDRLVAHEWGTFTSIAGEDGRAIEWLPLNGPVDLPCFVEHFQNSTSKILPTENATLVDYETARSRLWGKVRMETPVLYFYGPRDTHVNVKVSFPRGLITEFYPHATTWQPAVTSTSLHSPQFVSTLEWPSVTVAPPTRREFLTQSGPSHYYAARETEASALSVGSQSEKFLFYRGVANFDVALSALPVDGGGVRVRNLGGNEIPAVVLFEKRGNAFGYRVSGPLRGETTIPAPSAAGTMAALRADLEAMLVTAGLFPKEAAAMVATWSDSWFEEGTRVFYIVPPKAVEAILPLHVTPVPSAVARVFVGRMEVVTAATQHDAEAAIARNDMNALERFGRFLGPITDRMLAKNPNAATRARIQSATSAAFASYVRRMSACE